MIKMSMATMMVLSMVLLGCTQTATNAMEKESLTQMEEKCEELEQKEASFGIDAIERDSQLEDWEKCEEFEQSGAMMDKGSTERMEKENSVTKSDGEMMKETSYAGIVLAGDKSVVLDFTQSDYDAAFASDKTILLYFYANWCPICKREVQEMYSAFNELDNENIIAFRVNYKDSDTDSNEEALARQYGISYQHTKVILKNGQQIKKSPDSWDKEHYLAELKEVS